MISKFMEVHNNPHDTSRHNETAGKLEVLETLLATVITNDLSNNSPITNSDPSSATVVDPKGNAVDISVNEKTGELSYQFDKSYSDKTRASIEKKFKEQTAPVLEAMAQTEMGRKDIQILNTTPTTVRVKYSKKSNNLVNSYVFYGEVQENGYFDEVDIEPFFGNHKKLGSDSDFNEWLGGTMTVEVGHLEKEQVKLDAEARESNPRYLHNPKSKEFQKSYKSLLNKATSYRIKYRQEKKQNITEEVFKPLDKYGIEYSEENKKAREEFDNQ